MKLLRYWWLAAFLMCRFALADPAPQTLIRARLDPAGPVVAGAQVRLVVDVLTTTWFTAAPDWPLFTVDNALVTLPDEQAVNLSETIDGTRWFGVSRAYRIAPRAGGVFAIEPFVITVFPGGMTTPVKLTTPRLSLTATLPPGAENMTTFFPAPGLKVTQTVEPSKAHVSVGETVSRTITQSADATESMLIPPLAFGDIDGLRRYPTRSSTRNIVQDRAGLVAGERTDTATFVVNRSGSFTLPPIRIEWWNTATQKPETVTLPAVRFTGVAAKERPLFEIPVDALTGAAAHRVIRIDRRHIVVSVILLGCVLALVWGAPRIAAVLRRTRTHYRDARRRYAEGDAAAWRRLRRASKGEGLKALIPALYEWMDKRGGFAHPARVVQVRETHDPSLDHLADAVTQHYSADANVEAAVRWPEVERALRRVGKRSGKDAAKHELPPLNGD